MLTNATVKAARPGARAQKIWDEDGLFLHISPAGTKAWRCRFRSRGREATITLGQWPDLSLADARVARDQERARFEGREIAAAPAIAANAVTTFEAYARAWLERQRAHWSAEHAGDVESYLVRHVFSPIGAKPIATIKAADIIAVLLAVEDSGARQLARRLRQWLAKIFRRAIAEQVVESNPAAGVGDTLAPAPEARHKSAVLTIAEARAAYAALLAADGTALERLAAQLLALTGVRSAGVRDATWWEFVGIDWEDPLAMTPAAIWTIPAARMKLSVERKTNEAYAHIVPLSKQAVAVLRAARALTYKSSAAGGGFVFASSRSAAGGLPVNSIGALHARAGLAGRHCPHGWRSTYATIMNERRPHDRAAIDASLAHLPKDKVEAAYNRSVNLLLRREIFQEWAETLTAPIDA